MSGGLLQLVAVGLQDQVIYGAPDSTFFRAVFKKVSQFAIEPIENVIQGSVGWGKRCTATISRNGDLLYHMYLEVTLKKKFLDAQGNEQPWTRFPAEAIIKDISLDIGGSTIVKYPGEWLRVYDELFRTNDADKKAYARMTNWQDEDPEGAVKKFYLPLQFWFNRSPGLALPLIALHYHDTKVSITFADSGAVAGLDPSVFNVALFADYVYLEENERKVTAKSNLTYIIEQVQVQGPENVPLDTTGQRIQNVRIPFNHPVKALVMTCKDPAMHGKFTADDVNSEYASPISSIKLTLNGHDRTSVRSGSYWNKVVPWQYAGANPRNGLYLMSFGLDPANIQPSGTLNMSRIDNASLTIGYKKALTGNNEPTTEDEVAPDATSLTQLFIYAINYNVLRIAGGLGGIGFAN